VGRYLAATNGMQKILLQPLCVCNAKADVATDNTYHLKASMCVLCFVFAFLLLMQYVCCLLSDRLHQSIRGKIAFAFVRRVLCVHLGRVDCCRYVCHSFSAVSRLAAYVCSRFSQLAFGKESTRVCSVYHLQMQCLYSYYTE